MSTKSALLLVVLFITIVRIIIPDDSSYVGIEEQLKRSDARIASLTDSIAELRAYSDSIGRINDSSYFEYKQWKRDSSDFKDIKTNFNEIRKHNSTLTVDEHLRVLSEWLEEVR